MTSVPLTRLGLFRLQWNRLPRLARQICVAVAGTTVLLAGVAMIVLPGPAVLVIPLALAILGTEFLWARKLLDAVKVRFAKVERATLGKLRARRQRRVALSSGGGSNVEPLAR
jgi:uncharacterized protein (TIGR02611 family)